MSKRDYTICCVCETHYTCLRSIKKPHETHINWRQLASNAYIGFQHWFQIFENPSEDGSSLMNLRSCHL